MIVSFLDKYHWFFYSIYIKNIYNISLIIQPALSSKNNKCLNKLKVIKNVSLKFKISDALHHKLKVNYNTTLKKVTITYGTKISRY